MIEISEGDLIEVQYDSGNIYIMVVDNYEEVKFYEQSIVRIYKKQGKDYVCVWENE